MFRSKPSVPRGLTDRWLWDQRWRDLAFLHWNVPAALIRPHLPPDLDVDTHRGRGWLSLVLFRFDVRLHGLRIVPGLAGLPEINLRTYVRYRGVPGVYFLSLHVGSRTAAWLARRFTPLPYHAATLTYEQSESRMRFEGNAGEDRVSFDFEPTGSPSTLATGSAGEWLLERYRAYAWNRRSGLNEAVVAHAPWSVCDVGVRSPTEVRWGATPRQPPDLMHFSKGVDVLFGRFCPVNGVIRRP